MRRPVILSVVVLFSCLAVFSVGRAQSLTDQLKWPPGAVPSGQTNAPDSLDDIWQGTFNAWAIEPSGDEDHDGCSNFIESVSGTNPFLGNDCFRVGDMVISGGAVVFTTGVERDKKYRVLSSDSPNGTWTPETLQTPVAGVTTYFPSADQSGALISIQKAADSRKFYRLETSDVDSNGDGLSDWAARELGFNPTDVDGDSNDDGVADAAEVTQELQAPEADVITVEAGNSFASEDGGSPGTLKLRRNRSLYGATITYIVGGTAAPGSDYAGLSGTVHFAPGQKEATITVTPGADGQLEGGESVTVTFNNDGVSENGAPLTVGGAGQASVIIGNTTAPSGTGLLARYYDHANGTYAHAANFGDLGNYTFTLGNPTTTGTIVVTPTTGNLTNLLAAVSAGAQVRLTFNGGTLSSTAYNHLLYTVTSKTAANFTCSITSASTLPANSSSTCNFSIQPVHPPVIARVDPTVDFEWMGGTPNGAGVAAAAGTTATNVPDNYSDTFETFLHPSAAGSYRFQLDADDKARVLLDLDGNGSFDLPGEEIVEHGWDGAATPETVGSFKISSAYTLAVPAIASQRYKLRVEHVETTGEARCRLQWSRDGGSFGNIAQSEQYTHTQAATYAFTRGTPVTTGTATITLAGHGLAIGNQVTLAFASGTLFTPNTVDLNGYSGTYTVATVPDANSFTVAVNSAGSTLPSNQSSGASCFLENRSASSTTGVFNKTYTNTGFASTPGRIGVDAAVTTSNNGLWGTGTPDSSLMNPDTFSIRWTGQVQPQYSEDYTFVVYADDGASLWLNGQLQEMKSAPSTNSGVGTYDFSSATGDAVVNYANSVVKPGSFIVGETVRLDPSSGNLIHGSGSTYTYDGTTGMLTVNYANLTNITPGGFTVGETIELDPTGGPLSALSTLPYEITGEPSNSTFTVYVEPGLYDSGSGSINIMDTRSAVISKVFATGCTYTYTSSSGAAVITYSSLAGVAPGSFPVGAVVELDPTAGTLSSLTTASYTITNATSTTFTVTFPTGMGNQSSGVAINIASPANGVIPPSVTTAFAVNFGTGKYSTGTGNMSVEIVNEPLKDWSSMGNERYVRIPMVAGVRYDIQLDYWENGGFSRCKLYWYSPSQPKQIIPQERLYPSSEPQAPSAHTTPTDATALVGGAFSLPVMSSNGGSVSISGNPDWLSYTNGAISGTPPSGAAGLYQILITMTGAAGTSTSVLNLRVDDPGGTIVREYWSGLSGTSVASIPVGSAPTGSGSLPALEAPTDFGDDYGARIRGYLTAPETGNYYFWIAGSNAAELWISNDDEPINAIKRAWVNTGSSTPQNWSAETNQKSRWLALEQGRRYYIEILHKAGAGVGDNLAVGWAKPGQSTSTPSQIVPGYVLTPYTAPAEGSSPGTLYLATMLAQSGVVTNGVGSGTLRVNENETVALIRFNASNLTGPVTNWHVKSDPYLTHSSQVLYDSVQPAPGDGFQPDGSYQWTLAPAGTLALADVRELIKQGKAYLLIYTAANPGGEIRGNFTSAAGSRSFSPPPEPPSWTDDHTDANAAVRFLTQATFGPRISDITALQGMASYEAWIDDQFTKPAGSHLAEVIRTEGASAQGGAWEENLTFNAWWWKSIAGEDQLRQRMAFALSEIHVVSAVGPLDNRANALSYFYDKLASNAFGNFRDILEDTTLTPAMGRYLDMLRNDKPDQTVGRIPNENYAREIKQLFSVGLYRLWPDGTLMLNSKDSPIDTYTQREIIGFAHVFTGWDYGYDGAYHTSLNASENWIRQMREVPARHYTGPKRLLNNEVLPGLSSVGGQTLDPLATHNTAHFNDPGYQDLPAQELDAAHDQLFNHPNVGPFICRQLIQRLVTSNPSRDYLYRVVQKFNDNGSGVRGDMKAVIKAILLDYEARSPDMLNAPTFGKQREPLLRVAAAARAFRLDGWSGTYTQSGLRKITVDTSSPHKLATGNRVLLGFTSGDTKPPPWTGTYAVTYVDSDTFSVDAEGWVNANSYSIPANSTTCTVTMTNHWLQAGHQVFVDFTSGGADGNALVDQRVNTVLSATAETGTNGTFTFSVPSSTSARSGTCMIPRFSPGSYTVTASGLAAPYDRRVTMDTNVSHHLNPGDQVQINFYGGFPQPNDRVAIVESVVDENTWTFLAASSGTGLSTLQGYDAVYQFPLVSQPLDRSGTVGNRPSTYAMNNTDLDLGQSPLNSLTVFNFYLPDYKFPGALASSGITTPEFQLTAETNVVRLSNYLYNGIFSLANTNGISSFYSGSQNGALVMDFSPWMAASASNLGLGAPAQSTVPWTDNQNLTALIDNLSTLLVAGQLSTEAKSVIRNFVATPIASITPAGLNCHVTTTVDHNLNTGDTVLVSGVSDGAFSPSLNSNTATRTITKTSSTSFTLNSVTCTSTPTAGGVANAHVSVVQYNQGTNAQSIPQATDTHKRDRLRSIIHLILTSPDFSIQR